MRYDTQRLTIDFVSVGEESFCMIDASEQSLKEKRYFQGSANRGGQKRAHRVQNTILMRVWKDRNIEYLRLPETDVIRGALGCILYPGYPELKGIEIPEGVRRLEDGAFAHIGDIQLRLPKSLEVIGENVFSRSSLSKLTIPSNVRSISPTAFRYCNELKEIDVSPSNKYFCSECGILYTKDKTTLLCIPEGKRLGRFTLPDSVQEIVDIDSLTSRLKEIEVSSDNGYFSSADGVLFDKQKTKLVAISKRYAKSYLIIPSTVDEINAYIGQYIKINTLCISEGVKEIGVGAFEYSWIEQVYLPTSVTNISIGAFLRPVNLVDVEPFNMCFYCADEDCCAAQYVKNHGWPLEIMSEEEFRQKFIVPLQRQENEDLPI